MGRALVVAGDVELAEQLAGGLVADRHAVSTPNSEPSSGTRGAHVPDRAPTPAHLTRVLTAGVSGRAGAREAHACGSAIEVVGPHIRSALGQASGDTGTGACRELQRIRPPVAAVAFCDAVRLRRLYEHHTNTRVKLASGMQIDASSGAAGRTNLGAWDAC